jgi:hypothetical protein
MEWEISGRLLAPCPVFGIVIHHARTVADGVVEVHDTAPLVVESETFLDAVHDNSEVVAVNVEPKFPLSSRRERHSRHPIHPEFCQSFYVACALYLLAC